MDQDKNKDLSVKDQDNNSNNCQRQEEGQGILRQSSKSELDTLRPYETKYVTGRG